MILVRHAEQFVFWTSKIWYMVRTRAMHGKTRPHLSVSAELGQDNAGFVEGDWMCGPGSIASIQRKLAKRSRNRSLYPSEKTALGPQIHRDWRVWTPPYEGTALLRRVKVASGLPVFQRLSKGLKHVET